MSSFIFFIIGILTINGLSTWTLGPNANAFTVKNLSTKTESIIEVSEVDNVKDALLISAEDVAILDEKVREFLGDFQTPKSYAFILYYISSSDEHGVAVIDQTGKIITKIVTGIDASNMFYGAYREEVIIKAGSDFYIVNLSYTITPIDPSADLPILIPTMVPSIPLTISGESKKNVFLSQTDLYNALSWLPPTSTESTSSQYKIFRNSQLIATIPASNPLVFEDHNRKKNQTNTYFIIAENSDGETIAAGNIVLTSFP